MLPAKDEKRTTVRTMFDRIAPKYDLMNRLLTLRLDVHWRRRVVRKLDLAPKSKLADLACGTGDFCRELTENGHRAFGFDLSMGMLQAANCASSPLVQADVLALPLKDSCMDGATCGFALRNLVDIPPLFEEMARIVRLGGRIGILEISEPSNLLLRCCHGIYFDRIVPFIGGLLSDRDAYRYLPRSKVYLPSTEKLTEYLASVGFIEIRHEYLNAGIAQLITATRGLDTNHHANPAG